MDAVAASVAAGRTGRVELSGGSTPALVVFSLPFSLCVQVFFIVVAMFHVHTAFKHAGRRATMRGAAAFHAAARRGGDTFRVLGLQQIAVGGLDKDKQEFLRSEN